MRYLPHPNVVARLVDGEIVLVHLETNRIFTLNVTGTHIWEILNGDEEVGDLQTLERRLQEQYDVDDDVLHADITALLRQFEEEQLMVHDSGAD